MAFNLETLYPGKVDPASPDYPYGKPRNATEPSTVTYTITDDGGTPRQVVARNPAATDNGMPWESAWVSGVEGFHQALMSEAGIVPDGTPERVGASQYLQALLAIFADQVANSSDLVFANELDMTNGGSPDGTGTTTGGVTVTYAAGQALKINGEDGQFDLFIVTATASDIDLGNSLYAKRLTPKVGRSTIRQTMVIFGDSITEQNIESSNYSDRGYYNWANMQLGLAFKLLNNAGVGGDTTSDMLARIETDVLDFNSGYVWIHGGVNDIATTSDSGALIFSRIEEMVTKCIRNGSIVILSTVVPTTNMNTASKAEAYYVLNELIRNYCEDNDNIILVDFASAYNDPDGDISGYPNPISGFTIDGTHPNSKGAFSMGTIAYHTLKNLVKLDRAIWPTSNTDSKQFLPNGMSTGTGGAIIPSGSAYSGDVSDNTELDAGAGTTRLTAYKEERPQYGLNEWQSVYMEGDGSATGYARLQQSRSTVTTGVTVKAYAEVELLDDIEDLRSLSLVLNCRDGANAVVAQAVGLLDTSASYGNIEKFPRYGVIETTEIVVPATSVTNQFLLNWICIRGTLKLGRCWMEIV